MRAPSAGAPFALTMKRNMALVRPINLRRHAPCARAWTGDRLACGLRAPSNARGQTICTPKAMLEGSKPRLALATRRHAVGQCAQSSVSIPGLGAVSKSPPAKSLFLPLDIRRLWPVVCPSAPHWTSTCVPLVPSTKRVPDSMPFLLSALRFPHRHPQGPRPTPRVFRPGSLARPTLTHNSSSSSGAKSWTRPSSGPIRGCNSAADPSLPSPGHRPGTKGRSRPPPWTRGPGCCPMTLRLEPEPP